MEFCFLNSQNWMRTFKRKKYHINVILKCEHRLFYSALNFLTFRIRKLNLESFLHTFIYLFIYHTRASSLPKRIHRLRYSHV